jgi:hypothetical protein
MDRVIGTIADHEWQMEKCIVVHAFLQKRLSEMIAIEEYEKCAELRDLIADLSDYILGYRKFDAHILEIIYYVSRYFGHFVSIEEFSDGCEISFEVMYMLEGRCFYFQVDLEEAMEIKKEEENG